jgi:hypothetical protein
MVAPSRGLNCGAVVFATDAVANAQYVGPSRRQIDAATVRDVTATDRATRGMYVRHIDHDGIVLVCPGAEA